MLAALTRLSWGRVDRFTVFWMKTSALPEFPKTPASLPGAVVFRPRSISLTLGPLRSFAGFLDIPKGTWIEF